MQEIITRPNLPDTGKGTRKRVARPKPLRQPWEKAEGTAAVIASGLFTLKLRVIPNTPPDLGKVLADLCPAYQRFCELMNVEPKDISDQYAIINMYDHLEELLGQHRMLNIYEDDHNDGKICFVYLTPLGDAQSYGTVFYEPIVSELLTKEKEPYRVLFHKCLRSLKDISVNDWNDFHEHVYDWMEERTMDLEHSEEPEGEDMRNSLDNLQDIYLNGQAKDALAAILTEEPLTESDLDFGKIDLDPEHPVCKYAAELIELLKIGQNLQVYAEEPDDNSEYYLAFPEQFCIYYDLDDLFYEHEEHINSLANEGVQTPRLVTKITADMETVPTHDDPFPARLLQFFDKHSDLAERIVTYHKKGGDVCKE